MSAKHRHAASHRATHKWLGTGALALGIGAAALAGAGVAEAKAGEPSDAASTNHGPSDHKPPSAQTHKKAHNPSPTAASAPVAASATGASTTPTTPMPKSKGPKATAAIPATLTTAAPTAATVAPTTPVASAVAVATKPVAAVTATAKPLAATTAAATTTTTNPITALVTAIQKALLGFQSMFFNTPPKITVSTPTKGADGTYTGQIVASDADGDPLTIYFDANAGGTTTLQSTGTNTYSYTYTPSATALATPGYSHDFSFAAQENNAASHWHGFAQMLAYIETLGGGSSHAWFLYNPLNWGTTTAVLVVNIVPAATTSI